MNLLGDVDPHELDPDEVERLEHLIDDPLMVNVMSESELRSYGIFSPYQAAVISDYISRHGPIMSLTELASLDGFGDVFADRVAPFISLKPNDSENSGLRHELAVKGGLRWQDGYDGNYGVKYRIQVHDRVIGVASVSRSAGTDTWSPSAYSGSISYKFRRVPIRVVAGDFNARFGQGLVLWNNSFMNTLTTPDTFMKKPTGITQPWSFTGSAALHGLAAEYNMSRIKISAVASFADHNFIPAVNVSWFGRYGHTSITSTMTQAGLDAAFCIRGVNLFGELAFDWNDNLPSALIGTRFRTGENLDMAFQARAFMKDQYGAAAGCAYSLGQRGQVVLSADTIYYLEPKDDESDHSVQVKGLLSCELSINSRWKVKFRLSERYRTWGLPHRTDVRTDVVYTSAPLVLMMRLNVLHCDGTGYLSYVEGGYMIDKLTLYLRQGLFCIDDWDDRIYVYERDAPGSFTSPAMYGRGVWTALTAATRLTRSIKLYARASFIGYPFMEKKKPGKAELKLQLQYRF